MEEKFNRLTGIIKKLVMALIEINVYFEAAKDKNYRVGRCGELSRACLAYLLVTAPNLSVAKFHYYHSDQSRKNHAFIIMSLNAPSGDINDLNSWDHTTLVCDPYAREGEQLYFLNYAPEISAIKEMKKVNRVVLQFFSSKIIMDQLSIDNPSLYKEINTLIQSNYDLLCSLNAKELRFSPRGVN